MSEERERRKSPATCNTGALSRRTEVSQLEKRAPEGKLGGGEGNDKSKAERTRKQCGNKKFGCSLSSCPSHLRRTEKSSSSQGSLTGWLLVEHLPKMPTAGPEAESAEGIFCRFGQMQHHQILSLEQSQTFSIQITDVKASTNWEIYKWTKKLFLLEHHSIL